MAKLGRPAETDPVKRKEMEERKKEQKKAASDRYEKKFSYMKLRMTKDMHDQVAMYAIRQGISYNQYVLNAIEEELKKEVTKTD